MSEKKILVVDDEEVIRSTFELAFGKKGYTVRCAESAEEALEILKDEKILVMFLDLSMPGMSGVELCRRIRKDFPMAIIYAVTGHSSIFEPAEVREAGFDGYLDKPVLLEQIYKAAQDAFNKLEM